MTMNENVPTNVLYRLFMQFSSNEFQEPRITLMKGIMDYIRKEGDLVDFELPNPREKNGSQIVKCYVLDHDKTASVFKDKQDFYQHLSLYFGFMTEHYDDETGYPYPILVRIYMFGHNGQFLMCAKAQALRTEDPQEIAACRNTIFITVKDEHFPGTRGSKKTKKNTFNFDAYKDMPKALKSCKIIEKDLAKMILENLIEQGGGEIEPSFNLPMNVIRALCMAIWVPFIAEIAPPPDDALDRIRKLYEKTRSQLCSTRYLDECLRGIGGSNPGSHIYYLALIKQIVSGQNQFESVLAGKRQTHVPKCPRCQASPPANKCANYPQCEYSSEQWEGPKAEYIPARVGGLVEYRLEMFNNQSTAIQSCESWSNLSNYLGLVCILCTKIYIVIGKP